MSAELTTIRVDTPSRPFPNIGVDLTGHLMVKYITRNIRKSQDLHLRNHLPDNTSNKLGMVEDLTTEKFLIAFRGNRSVFPTQRFILADNA